MGDSVPDTPVRERTMGTASSEDEDIHDTVATLPVASLTPSQRFTQPTQIIDSPHSRPKHSIVQVAASSPTAPSLTNTPPRRGLLSSLLAPAGTQFRSPSNSARPAKRSPILNFDDGPTYLGGSSDEEESYAISSTDIKPAMFEKTRSPDKVAESPVRSEAPGSAFDRFKEITAAAKYDPTSSVKRSAEQLGDIDPRGAAMKKARLSTDSQPKSPVSSSLQSTGATEASRAKRSAEQLGGLDPHTGTAIKKARLSTDSQPQSPATTNPHIQSTNDIDDYRVKVKVERMLKIVANKTVQECVNALVRANGNYDVALDIVTKDPAQSNNKTAIIIESSDDELSSAVASSAAPLPAAKQQIRARNTIHNKYRDSANLPPTSTNPTSRDQGTDGKPRGRLMRGPRDHVLSRDASPQNIIVVDDDATPPKPKPGRLQKGRRQPIRSPSPLLTDSEDEEVQLDDSKSVNLHNQVFKFLNTCDTRDLADIAAIPEDHAKVITDNRPYRTLDDIRLVQAPVDESAKPKGKGKARRAPKPIGDKIVDKCLEMWEGYMAVDSLVAECAKLGKPIADEMKKWGVDIFGKPGGDLELTSMTAGTTHDSGIATPSSSHPSPGGGNKEGDDDDEDDGPVSASRKPKSQGSQFISQPDIMAKDLVMKDYQIVGLNWLALLFEKEMSCILADDMGLGKTCQVISFLAHLFTKGIKGPHLVVVPASTIENWIREFTKFCPDLHVIPYYAGQNERAEIRHQIEENRDDINVVITTYTIAKNPIDTKFLRNQEFTVCVYDEGHMLKNSRSQLYEKLIRIPAKFRLLLTGTPLQNNLQELASLLGFILPEVFKSHKDDLKAIFANKAKTTDESHAALLSAQRIGRAKSMLKPFVLRRKKHQVIDLPDKVCRVQYCDMKTSQSDIYREEQENVRRLLEDRAAGKKTGSKSANILMKLRQAAIHPLLSRRIYTEAVLKQMSRACLNEPVWRLSDPDVILEELREYSDYDLHGMCKKWSSLGKFRLRNEEWMDSGKVEHLRKLLTSFIANGDRTLVFSQFTLVMDILEEVLETLKIRFVRLDGNTSVQDRQAILDAFHEDAGIPVFLLSTKAGGTGINLACANKVVIFDSSFNPQEDVQAENRAHRVGQTRDVEVIRFVTRDTIEEQIHALGQTKLALDQAVAGDEEGGSKGGGGDAGR
ncbi:ATP-dependent helicase fft2 [Penicillium chermesinum]|uniref:DNA helicase n=1 Tax=Penicillium chermesinum TaxID=63820 RepID=A0A9W9NHW6_9EURO|nr:ATP-dependent helicase fft2 [Penicillium chermesinum]KAJ5220275.1 ATP-dependent helicase fft2 [Penicillium chermesinum]